MSLIPEVNTPWTSLELDICTRTRPYSKRRVVSFISDFSWQTGLMLNGSKYLEEYINNFDCENPKCE